MEVVGPGEFHRSSRGSAVTIGAYDGVHVGHRQLLARIRTHARRLGLDSVVVTFDRHPATVIRPESAPLLLTDLDQKLELLAECGVDATIIVPFDAARSEEPAEEFVSIMLVETLGARMVVVGEDFHFGHGRQGNVSLLRRLGERHGFGVDGVEIAGEDGAVVSSTRIRSLLAAGDVSGAAALLGRPHQVRGRVVRGDGRGGSVLGFPTANVEVPKQIAVPGSGIYAGWFTHRDGTVHQAAISVGRRPTFYPPEHGEVPELVEAHLLDFEGNLYEQPARVSFTERLRDERRFERTEDLVAQMARDVEQARELLGGSPI
ncbi:MAG: bifunctional riboflavin kinase/FAD synthetase [Acidimicrobiales bacterium]